jgi:hypothetical protein
MISERLGYDVSEIQKESHTSAKSPGTRYTHYKPKAAVRWISSLPKNSHPAVTIFSTPGLLQKLLQMFTPTKITLKPWQATSTITFVRPIIFPALKFILKRFRKSNPTH